MGDETYFVRSSSARLVIASATALFLELSCIRWAGSHVVYLSYVANLLLITAFFGLGIGTWLGASVSNRARTAWLGLGPHVLLAFVACVAFSGFSVQINGGSVVYFGTALLPNRLPAWLVLPLLGMLVAGVFTSLGTVIGRELQAFGHERALGAYSLDVIGSLIGIALFSTASFLGASSQLWFGAALLGWLALMPARRAWIWAAALSAMVTLGIVQWADWGSWFSPYQRVSLEAPTRLTARAPGDPTAGSARYRVSVNNIVHQHMSDVRVREPFYEFPYRAAGAVLPGGADMYLSAKPPHANWQVDPFAPRAGAWGGRVAIIGAGNGTDVAVALAYGASHIDAIELDPQLAQIGEQLHPNRPFADPRVHLHVLDGRTFLERNREHYDVIIFGLPDSLTLASPYASVRLESFLFTEEAFKSALRGLDPDHGLLVLYNYYREPWLVDRIAGTMARAAGHEPLVWLGPDRLLSAVFMAGPGIAHVDRKLGAGWGYHDVSAHADEGIAVEDWPFLYLRQRVIPQQICFALIGLTLLASLALWAVRRYAPRAERSRASLLELAPCFFMGVAFLLLETSGLVRMALLFGSTWFVNALVFGSVLIMVLIANAIASRWQLRSALVFMLLLAALGLAYAVKPSALASWDALPKYVVATCLLFVPILLANLSFSRALANSASPASAFGANLLGAVLGGALENLALVIGHSALLLIAAGLYSAAWLCTLLARAHVESSTRAEARSSQAPH